MKYKNIKLNCRGTIIEVDHDIIERSVFLTTACECNVDNEDLNIYINFDPKLVHKTLNCLRKGETDNEEIVLVADFFGFDIKIKEISIYTIKQKIIKNEIIFDWILKSTPKLILSQLQEFIPIEKDGTILNDLYRLKSRVEHVEDDWKNVYPDHAFFSLKDTLEYLRLSNKHIHRAGYFLISLDELKNTELSTETIEKLNNTIKKYYI